MLTNELDSNWKEIDESGYLFLNRLFEPQDNSLTIILEQAIVNKTEDAKARTANVPYLTDIGESWPIEPTADCRVFTLHWKSYVSYCVTEEMHGSCGKYEDEDYSGRLLRVYSKSHFLNFIEKDTGAHFEPYRHYKIACQNHNVDIVSTTAPELNSLSRKEAGLAKS